MKLTRPQVRAARALLEIRQHGLAKLAGISPRTIAAIEKPEPVSPESMAAVVEALSKEGIRFLPDGVRLEKRSPA